MAQVKKESVRQAILDSAFELITRQGYAATTLAQIARGAGIATSNVYVYFESKLGILFALSRPWLLDQLERLEAGAGDYSTSRDRLRGILLTVWDDLPSRDGGFAYNVMQALSSVTPQDRYSTDLLTTVLARVSQLIRGCLPDGHPRRGDSDHLAYVVWMAFDGFAINRTLSGRPEGLDRMVELYCDIILGSEPAMAADAASGRLAQRR
ncbi:TetR/AcrR family transcriptional regulator [Inquilinus sp. CAU 1745]|uniref:TetR/AcrR family transcriptional regulator n=1 Tax=Inquilinus sp. CAU 1745 TaxID=3140369 RepID=UPI00325AB311